MRGRRHAWLADCLGGNVARRREALAIFRKFSFAIAVVFLLAESGTEPMSLVTRVCRKNACNARWIFGRDGDCRNLW